MTAERTPLAEAFVIDHREITRGLARLSQAVRDGDFTASRELALDVDRLAGPHILFEEQVLYPQIARLLGRDYAVQLYGEHEAGRSALEQLTRSDRPAGFRPGEQEELSRLLGAAVEHAATCATLVSRLSEFPRTVQIEMQARLDECHAASPAWTSLPRDGVAHVGPPDAAAIP
ncbi:MAG TPA: hemerythrin domain-containing protein [Planctomycetaceae bacterium]|nr:hemerythrin domain-containing protein [Planctomycetaceae bacterium]